MASILDKINSSKRVAKNNSENKQKAKTVRQNVESKTTSKLSKGAKYHYAGNRVKNAMSNQQYYKNNPNPEYANQDKLKYNKERLFNGGKMSWEVGTDEKDASGKKTGVYRKYTEKDKKNRLNYIYSPGSNHTTKDGKVRKNVKLLAHNEYDEYMRNANKGVYPGMKWNNKPINKVDKTGSTGKTMLSPLKDGIKQASKSDSLLGKVGAIGAGIGATGFNAINQVSDALNTLNYGAHGFASGFVDKFNNDGKLNKGELKSALDEGINRAKTGVKAGISTDKDADEKGRYGFYDTFKSFSDNKQEKLNRQGKYLSKSDEKKRNAKLTALGLGFDIGGAVLSANVGSLASKGAKLVSNGSKLSGNALKGLSKVANVADLGIDVPIADLVRGTGKTLSNTSKVATKFDDVSSVVTNQLDELGVGTKSQAIYEHIVNKGVSKTNKAKGIREVNNGVKLGGFELVSPSTVQKVADSKFNLGGRTLNTMVDGARSNVRKSAISGEVTSKVVNNTIAKGLKKGTISEDYVTTALQQAVKKGLIRPDVAESVMQEIAMTIDDKVSTTPVINTPYKPSSSLQKYTESLQSHKQHNPDMGDIPRNKDGSLRMNLDTLEKGSNVGKFTPNEMVKSKAEIDGKKGQATGLQLLSRNNNPYTEAIEELTPAELNRASKDPNWVKKQKDFDYNVMRDEGTLDKIYKNVMGDELKNATDEKWSDVVARRKAEKLATQRKYDVKPREYNNIMSKKDNELLNYLDELPDDVQDEFYDYIQKKDKDLYEALVMESKDVDYYSGINDGVTRNLQSKFIIQTKRDFDKKHVNDFKNRSGNNFIGENEKVYTGSDKKIPYESRGANFRQGVLDNFEKTTVSTLNEYVKQFTSKKQLPRKERLSVVKHINDSFFGGRQVLHDDVSKKDLNRFVDSLYEHVNSFKKVEDEFNDVNSSKMSYVGVEKRIIENLLNDVRLSHRAYTDPNYYKKLSQRTNDLGKSKSPIQKKIDELRSKKDPTPLDIVKIRELKKQLKPFDEWWEKNGNLDEDEWEKAFSKKDLKGESDMFEEYSSKDITSKDISNYRQDLYDSLKDEDIIPYKKYLESEVEKNPLIPFDKDAKQQMDIAYKKEVNNARKGVIDAKVIDKFGDSVVDELSYKNKNAQLVTEQKRNSEKGSARSLQMLQNGVGEIVEGSGSKKGKTISSKDMIDGRRKKLGLPKPIREKVDIGNQKPRDVPVIQKNVSGLRKTIESEHKMRMLSPDKYENTRETFEILKQEYIVALHENGVTDSKFYDKVTALQDKLNGHFERFQEYKKNIQEQIPNGEKYIPKSEHKIFDKKLKKTPLDVFPTLKGDNPLENIHLRINRTHGQSTDIDEKAISKLLEDAYEKTLESSNIKEVFESFSTRPYNDYISEHGDNIGKNIGNDAEKSKAPSTPLDKLVDPSSVTNDKVQAKIVKTPKKGSQSVKTLPISAKSKIDANNIILSDLKGVGYTTDEANKIIEQSSDVIKKALKGEDIDVKPSKALVSTPTNILDETQAKIVKTPKKGSQSVKTLPNTSNSNTKDKKEIIEKFMYDNDKPEKQSKLSQNPIVRLYDEVTKDFKAGATGINPGWNVMNAIQNKMNGYYGLGADVVNPSIKKDAKNVVDNIEGKRKWLGMEYGNNPSKSDLAKNTVGKNKDGSNISLEDVRDIVDMEGLVDDTFFKTETKNGKKSFVNNVLRPSGENSMWSLGGMHNNVRTESYDKVQQVLGAIKQGKTPTKGVENANKFLFDYDDITKGEKEIAKRIMPFYTYYRKNGALQAEQFANSPRNMASFLDAKNQAEKGIDDEDKQRRTEWDANKTQIPNTTMVEEGKDGNAFYNMMLNTSTPWDGLMQLPSLDKDVQVNNMPSTNPIIESLYQKYVTGKNYFGDDISDENIFKMLGENLVKPMTGTVGKLSDVKNQSIENNELLKQLEILTGVKAKYHKSWQDWGEFENDDEYISTKKKLVNKYQNN